MTWHLRAECLGEDPTLFFPPHHGQEGGLAYAKARRICARCEVIDDCLRDCLANESNGHRFGMRGGKTPRERERVKVQTLRCVICEVEVPVGDHDRKPVVVACSEEHYRQYRRAQQYATMGRSA